GDHLVRDTATRSDRLGRVATVLILLAVVLTAWQHAAWSKGERCWPERVLLRLLMPAVGFVSGVEAGVSDIAFSLAAAGKLGRENRWLREENARLRADKIRLAELATENRQLRKALKAPLPAKLEPVGLAEVISRSPGPMRRRVKIRVAGGVELAKNDILLSGGALVGRVLEATGSTGDAELIVDREHAVAAVDQRSRDQGMLYAQPAPGGPDLLRMDKLVGRCDLAVGDLVLTSGLGQVYPRGVPIGRIIAISAGPASSRVVSATVKPLADLDRLEFVLVGRVTGLR
ncbi:MAG: rod shape-determining protein MreC, partial [Armatimonadetes bacterium]|nr:rod shape-determining protein MreC [Armatimonadota bacterium]